jgi:hypothetical protein
VSLWPAESWRHDLQQAPWKSVCRLARAVGVEAREDESDPVARIVTVWRIAKVVAAKNQESATGTHQVSG